MTPFTLTIGMNMRDSALDASALISRRVAALRIWKASSLFEERYEPEGLKFDRERQARVMYGHESKPHYAGTFHKRCVRYQRSLVPAYRRVKIATTWEYSTYLACDTGRGWDRPEVPT